MDGFEDLIAEFLVESYENLDQYDQDLLVLEQTPDDREILSGIFRTIHTIKGTCGFLGFTRLERLTHTAENLLGRLRDGELVVTKSIASALLTTGDTVRGMLEAIEQTGQEGDDEPTALLDELARLHAGDDVADDAAEDDDTGAATGEADETVDDSEAAAADAGDEADDGDTPAEAAAGREAAPADGGRVGAMLRSQGVEQGAIVAAVQRQQLLDDPRRLGEILVAEGAATPDQVEAALSKQASTSRSVADATVRVEVGVLDSLMNLVGELVLVRNQIVQLTSDQTSDSAVSGASQRLNLITTELQEGVMKTRMQPIGHAWGRLPRVVRDLSVQMGKQVRVVMEGEDTELDKSIIEAIKDPLTHLVRNAVDHGLETPQVREAAGKSGEGTLVLRAFHEGGQVNIEISDDGAGIDPDRVRAKAVEREIVTAADAAEMGDRQALDLIFAPGFSTAEAVTNVSGRGVGTDVVRTNIERIGGTVDLHSRLGEGTTFKVKIPLTLAIIPALVVGSGDHRYAIPQVSLLELVRIGSDGHGIEYIHGAPVYRLRGRLLPLVALDHELGQVGRDDDLAASGGNIVVLQADGRQFGLIVDEIRDSVEIVVKPLGEHLTSIPVFAGTTIMGDGRVGLILDVLGLAERAHVLSDHHERMSAGAEGASDDDGTTATPLLITGVTGGHLGLPLPLVDRLERIPAASVERTGQREVVQYRGGILPLVRLGDLLPGPGVPGSAASDSLEVVVHATGTGFVGLVVDTIEDVIDTPGACEPGGRPGVSATAVINGRVTELVDLDALLRLSGVTTDPAFASA
jgi:two-component system chemotaxis sensor kinase CheA